MPSVLFVCTANRFRSPLAAALFQKIIQDNRTTGNWTIHSAGTWATSGLAVIPTVALVAHKYGIDLSRHRSVGVNREMLSTYDLILVMEAGHKEALQNEFSFCQEHVFLLSQVVENRIYDIPDLMDSMDDIEEVGMNLRELVRTGFDNICRLAVDLQKTGR